jgi:hypothetical protein
MKVDKSFLSLGQSYTKFLLSVGSSTAGLRLTIDDNTQPIKRDGTTRIESWDKICQGLWADEVAYKRS